MVDASQPVAIFGNGLGDHLLTLPALRALARLFEGRLSLVCMPGARESFFSDLSLRSVSEAQMNNLDGDRMFDAEAVATAVGSTDLFLSLNPWHSSAMSRLLDLLKPCRSIGFHAGFERVLPLDYRKHSAELAFDVPRLLDGTLRIEDFAAPPAVSTIAWEQARAVRSLVPAAMRVMAVHADTGVWTRNGSQASGAGVAPSQILGSKMWPVERFVLLLDEFLDRHPDIVVFVVGGENLGLDRGNCGRRVIPCCGLPIDVTLALVGQANFFIGVDSLMLHAADLYRVPSIGLFGPTNYQEFGCRFAPHRHVAGAGSMQHIEVNVVREALESLVQEHSAGNS